MVSKDPIPSSCLCLQQVGATGAPEITPTVGVPPLTTTLPAEVLPLEFVPIPEFTRGRGLKQVRFSAGAVGAGQIQVRCMGPREPCCGCCCRWSPPAPLRSSLPSLPAVRLCLRPTSLSRLRPSPKSHAAVDSSR